MKCFPRPNTSAVVYCPLSYNVFFVTPRSKVKLLVKMLKAIHAQKNKKADQEKSKAVAEVLLSIKLKDDNKKVEDSIEEALTRYDFPANV